MVEHGRTTEARQYAFFFNRIKANEQIIDLQGDRIFGESKGG
jgi:hypothetical protein